MEPNVDAFGGVRDFATFNVVARWLSSVKHLDYIAGPLIKAAMTAGFNFLLSYSVLVCLQDVLGSHFTTLGLVHTVALHTIAGHSFPPTGEAP